MATAYIICGQPSSGNRLLCAVFLRSGCVGNATPRQPQTLEEIPEPAAPLVLIKHYRVGLFAQMLRQKGYSRVVGVCIVREHCAAIGSQLLRGHRHDFANASAVRAAEIAAAIYEATTVCDAAYVTTYEGLSESALRHFLPAVGLPYVAGPLFIDGREVAIGSQENAKHYK